MAIFNRRDALTCKHASSRGATRSARIRRCTEYQLRCQTREVDTKACASSLPCVPPRRAKLMRGGHGSEACGYATGEEWHRRAVLCVTAIHVAGPEPCRKAATMVRMPSAGALKTNFYPTSADEGDDAALPHRIWP
ncbi:hypothetical protein K466DRAFT_380894 [Polyporus arcularius HHB13444]|uniref:Uncharacterized protein n=1 Tax=Polyporus arcularius HHB13444 TaxID=1314778 RepID=A0A5C3PL88_9APHY|nr:hypothetical protein K466DRAFT_380894 [Polyporus arcularius HHB13444]